MFPDFEFHHLQGFIAVARAGNFTKAAEELGLSQSALSRSIQKLEIQIGQPLFDRQPRQVILTPAGETFFPKAKQILSLVEDAFREISEGENIGHIRLAAIPTIAPFFLPGLLTGFSSEYPEIKVSVTESTSESIVKGSKRGEFDAAIIALPYPIENLKSYPLFDEELFLVLPSGHVLGESEEISVQDLQEIPFVMLRKEHCLSDQVETFCQRESVHPISIERTSQLATVQELVSLEHGISIIPDMARNIDSSEKRIYRRFAEPRPQRTISLLINPDRFQSRALLSFLGYLKKTYSASALPDQK